MACGISPYRRQDSSDSILPNINRLKIRRQDSSDSDSDSDSILPNIKRLKINTKRKSDSCCYVQPDFSSIKIESIDSFFKMEQSEIMYISNLFTAHKVRCIKHKHVVFLKKMTFTDRPTVTVCHHNTQVYNILIKNQSPYFIRFFGEFFKEAILDGPFSSRRTAETYLAYEYIEEGYSLSKIFYDIEQPAWLEPEEKKQAALVLLTEKHINYIFYQLLEIKNTLYQARIDFNPLKGDLVCYPTQGIIKVVNFDDAHFLDTDSKNDSRDRQTVNIYSLMNAIFKGYYDTDYLADTFYSYDDRTVAQRALCYYDTGWLKKAHLFNNITREILLNSWELSCYYYLEISSMDLADKIKHLNYDKLMAHKEILKKFSDPLPKLSELFDD